MASQMDFDKKFGDFLKEFFYETSRNSFLRYFLSMNETQFLHNENRLINFQSSKNYSIGNGETLRLLIPKKFHPRIEKFVCPRKFRGIDWCSQTHRSSK